MATAFDYSGLFGGTLTPEEQQMQMTETRAAQFAKLDPSQQLAFMGYKAGANLGQGLAQAAGVDIRDPIIKRNMSLYELAKGIDVTTTKGLEEYASRLQQAGFTAEAAQLGQKVLAARKTESEIKFKGRELMPEQQRLAIAFANTKADPDTPEWKAEYTKQLERLTTKEKTESSEIKEVGVAEGTRDPVYTYKPTKDATPQQVIFKTDASGKQVMVPYTGGVDRTTAKVSASVNQKQEEGLIKSNTEEFANIRGLATTAGTTLETVKDMRGLIDKSFAGAGANVQLKAGQIAELFGVPISGTSETEQLRSLQNNLKIGNSTVLKGAISDKDMAILGEAIGQGTTTKDGLKGILRNIEKEALINQARYKDVQGFVAGKGKLSDYDFVEGSVKARKAVNDKLNRLRELERKAGGQ